MILLGRVWADLETQPGRGVDWHTVVVLKPGWRESIYSNVHKVEEMTLI